MKKSDIFPGWLMTYEQHGLYFRLLTQAYQALGLTSKQAQEDQRKTIHTRAFGAPISAKEINHLEMFDAFKAECLAIIRPASVDAQLAQANMPRTRLLYAINDLANQIAPGRLSNNLNVYLAAILERRFGHIRLDDLTEEQLLQIRNTLAARLNSKRRKEAKEANPF